MTSEDIIIDGSFRIHNEAIEIGNSIKFSLANDSLDCIAELILYIEHIIENLEDRYKIPVFSKVSDDTLNQTLNDNLLTAIRNDPYCINISEFDIVGATEVFNHNDTTFKLLYRSFGKMVMELSQTELQQFANEYNFNLNEHLLDIKVISYHEGNSIRTDSLRNLIDYTDDGERCILSKGQWYQYNDDYLSYLSESLKEIDVIYNQDYNFSKAQRQSYLERKYLEEQHKEEYVGQSEEEVKKSIGNKYYAERYYNIMLAENYEFQNCDRVESRIGTADIELMDLYKDNTMFAVKIGASSGKLCYTVDQSIQAIKAYKHNLIENKPNINNVAIWIVLDRVNPLTIVDGKPDINELDMLIFKNKLDHWKKEVRVLGYKPLIYINYRIS